MVVEVKERFVVAVPPLLRTRLGELRDADISDGDVNASDTVPEKPLRLVKVMVELPEVPTRMLGEAGLAVMENSETLTVITVERVRVPLVALAVTE